LAGLSYNDAEETSTMPRRRKHPVREPFPLRPDASSDVRASRLRIGNEQYIVLSVPAPASAPPTLSEAEREVHAALLRGESNAAIALQRGTSVRTVANQVQSLFRKLGVRSRAELAVEVALVAAGRVH
jgi:DNA-binding NarL/FixJ family response regulator